MSEEAGMDFFDTRPPRSPMEDIADNTELIGRYASRIHEEVESFAAVAGERHGDLIEHISSGLFVKMALSVRALEDIKILLWAIIALLTYIAFRLK